ncbi:ABC-type Fe3+ transport system, periplasmic component [Sphaerochaeta pleomorpha str. Grapes]|uniref:ABC-type Fe3+ transport system, periplasmic component n=1 Tax=Sphaerochaeta pleomorpha (strain ATCC BAA-1885 / DSM 22778 / Grapes) TaxID=158190 RepID=G8QY51_SPHPG|nr:extracellular solute-binding protein [Sphaerochaeta pleomorpha]AEV29616.1 ABC-type Fe3+ transport system, periplasmic component [Sphaerochaeta pleomorpha str. Grapes]
MARKRSMLVLALFMVAFSLVASGKSENTGFPYDKRKVITVYTPHEQQPMTAAVKEFQETSGITVHILSAGTGSLLERIQNEQRNGNNQCDVFWGGGAESIEANSDLFEPYISRFDSLVPENSKDPKHRWIGESPSPVIIAYNTKLLSPQEIPLGWKDLLDPKWKGKIAFADPEHSGSAYTLLNTMLNAMGGEEGGGWEYLEQLVANLDGNLLANSSEAYLLVETGEYYIGLSQEKSIQTAINGGANLAIAYPVEGTSAVPDAIAVVKGCSNPDGAYDFIDFILGEANQNMMSNLFNRRPIRADLQPPPGLPPIQAIPLIDYDLYQASIYKAKILERWRSIL